MPAQRRGLGLMRLVATDGHSHWVEPALHAIPGAGYTLGVDCTFGGVALTHYVARNEMGQAYWRSWPYAFASIAQAEAARDELASAQQQGEAE